MSEIIIVNTQEEHVEQLAAMQHIVFPTLTDDELFTAAKYRKHIEIFPDGQFTAILEDGTVVGATSTFRTTFDFDDIQHTFLDAIADGWLTKHDPHGDWLYGADVSVHPEYRRRGVGSKLYNARKALVKRLNLRGEIAGGMLPGYAKHKDQISVEAYIEGVVKGDIIGPTLTMQVKNGFIPRGVLYDHITDPRSDNHAALLVRENPDYQEAKI